MARFFVCSWLEINQIMAIFNELEGVAGQAKGAA